MFTKKNIFEYLIMFASVIVSSVLFFVSVVCFIQSQNADMLSSGASGVSLIIARLSSNDKDIQNAIYSIFYLVINIPIFILGYTQVGKRFAVFSLFNVLLSSILIAFVPVSAISALNLHNVGDPLAIALFAGMFSGLSTGISFKFNTSGGGLDIIVLYLSIKKGLNSGRYMKIINFCIVIVGGLLLQSWLSILYTFVYIFTSATIVDVIHIRNKKVVLQVITTMGEEIGQAVIKATRHSCTIINGSGAYTGSEKQMIFTVISSFERDYVIKLIKEVDPNSFITVTTADMVASRFYVPPLK